MRVAGCALRFLAFSLFLLAPFGEADAGFERRNVGPRSFGAAGVLGEFGDGPWCYYLNPAHVTDITEAGFFYTPSLNGLQEISSTGISFRNNSFGIDYTAAAQTFGFEMYRETVITLNLSVPLYDFLFIGSNTNINHLFIRDYGTDLSLSFDAGARMFLSDNFCLGLSATNLTSSSMTLSNDRLPQTFTGGIGYLSSAFNLGLEYYKEIGFPSAVRVAAEYSPVTFLTVRTGTASGTNSFNAGLSLRFSSFEVEYGTMIHRVLGTTHSFGISIRFGGETGSEYESIRHYRALLQRD